MSEKPSEKTDDEKRDEILKRMLKMPPKPHKPAKTSKSKRVAKRRDRSQGI